MIGGRPPPGYQKGIKSSVLEFRKHAEIIGFAEAHRLLEHRVENGGQVAGRRIDDLQHLGGRGLLLQGLARFSQESRVLHCDHRLRRKAL
jgi:hypothetical protein